MCACQKGSHSVPPAQALQAETMDTGDKNHNVPQRHTLFCEESLAKIDAKEWQAFLEQVSPWIRLLERVDYFGESEYFGENFDGEAINWSGDVNFHCVQMSLVMSMQWWLIWRAPCSLCFWSPAKMKFLSNWFSCIYTRVLNHCRIWYKK